MGNTLRILTLSVLIALPALPAARAQRPRQGNPFQPPAATVHHAPPHDYDLQHLAVVLDIDAASSAFRGTATNTLASTRDGLDSVVLHCANELRVTHCWIDGKEASYTREGDVLKIAAYPPLTAGKAATVSVQYASGQR